MPEWFWTPGGYALTVIVPACLLIALVGSYLERRKEP